MYSEQLMRGGIKGLAVEQVVGIAELCNATVFLYVVLPIVVVKLGDDIGTQHGIKGYKLGDVVKTREVAVAIPSNRHGRRKSFA